MKYKVLFILLVLVSILDVGITYTVVGYNYDLELNVVMKELLINYGYTGIISIKVMLLTLLGGLLSMLKKDSIVIELLMAFAIAVYVTFVIIPFVLV